MRTATQLIFFSPQSPELDFNARLDRANAFIYGGKSRWNLKRVSIRIQREMREFRMCVSSIFDKFEVLASLAILLMKVLRCRIYSAVYLDDAPALLSIPVRLHLRARLYADLSA